MMQPHHSENATVLVAGYVRRSSEMQKDNYSIDAQKRAIRDAAKARNLPEPTFFEDDERSARGEQIANRPDFKRLLDYVQANPGKVIVFVHTLDRWSRNVMVTLQSFRILSLSRTAFISLSEHIDYSTPEGMLQLTILAAFAAYFSDMLAKHTSKGKSERVAQGLYNGDIPFGFRSTGPKLPPEFDPEEYPGLRMLGELRMKGIEADKIADALNEAGYRTGSKRFGARLFNKDTVTAMLRNEFYAAYAPGDDRGTVKYKEQRFRGLHPAVFTYDEWQKIRSMTQSMHHASTRTEQVKHVYQFAGYISCIHCGLKLRCDTGNTPDNRRQYYRDAAKARRIPCPAGGNLMVRVDLVDEQFGELLKRLVLPENWREIIRRNMVAEALKAGVTPENVEREKERLKLKKSRTIKLYKEGYIEEDEEFQGEMAAIELAIKQLDAPEVDGITYDEVIEAGEHLPGMAALWDVASVEERYEMVTIILEPGGLYYDLENKIIAAIKPRPAFLPVLRMLNGVMEFDETRGLLVTEHWCDRNRRESGSLKLHQWDRQQRKIMLLSHFWQPEISLLWLMLIRFYGKSALLSHSVLRTEADSIIHCGLLPCNLICDTSLIILHHPVQPQEFFPSISAFPYALRVCAHVLFSMYRSLPNKLIPRVLWAVEYEIWYFPIDDRIRMFPSCITYKECATFLLIVVQEIACSPFWFSKEPRYTPEKVCSSICGGTPLASP